jgi:archaeal flagellin FlaB
MKTKFNHWMKDESGITALETAIILIAFVVVAAIFAFTVLSTGTFLTERSKEAAYGGLQEVRGSMELKGSVVAFDPTGNGDVNFIELTIATAAGGSSVDLNTNIPKIQITYHDKDYNEILPALKGTVNTAGKWIVSECIHCVVSGCEASGDCILPTGGLARIVVGIPANDVTNMKAYRTFSIELKPPTGGTMLVERTLPAQIDQVTDLK